MATDNYKNVFASLVTESQKKRTFVDKRSPVQKEQQYLFGMLGDIARTKINLRRLVDNTATLSDASKMSIEFTFEWLDGRHKQIVERMHNLPSKRRLVEAAKLKQQMGKALSNDE